MSAQTSPVRITRDHERCYRFSNTFRHALQSMILPLLEKDLGQMPDEYTIEVRLNSSDDGVTIRLTKEEEIL